MFPHEDIECLKSDDDWSHQEPDKSCSQVNVCVCLQVVGGLDIHKKMVVDV